jgi:hypothetical protein
MGNFMSGYKKIRACMYGIQGHVGGPCAFRVAHAAPLNVQKCHLICYWKRCRVLFILLLHMYPSMVQFGARRPYFFLFN